LPYLGGYSIAERDWKSAQVALESADGTQVRRVLWRAFLLVGVLAVALYRLVPRGGWQDLAYLAIGSTSVTAIAIGMRMHHPVRRKPWRLMLVGQLLWVIGDAVDSFNRDVRNVTSYPALTDLFYLAAYPLLGAGLFLLIRGRRPRHDLAGLLDSATVTAGLALLSWVLLAEPTLAEWDQSVAAATVSAVYPFGDILLVGLLIRLVTTPGGRTPSLRWLLTAGFLLVAGDTISAAVGLYSSSSTDAFDVIWLASYVAWGTAALHPSMFSLSEPTSGVDGGFSRARLAAMCLATMVAPAILGVQAAIGGPLDVWPVVVGSVLMFLFVVARMRVAIHQIIEANRRRDELQDELAYRAVHDSLTDLPNRAQAMRLIDAALNRAQRSGAMIGLLFIDLDGFKAVNDTLGHGAGDEVLRTVAQRLREKVRGGDVVSRVGGDEFVVLLEPVESEAEAALVANRLIETASEPIITPVGEARIGASIGVAISQDGSIDPPGLLHEADRAAYRAKSAGRGRAEMFDDAFRQHLDERSELEAALGVAIAEDTLDVYYQPIIDVATSRARGYEALVRWDRPGIGVVPPIDFIPTAEASNLICELDAWVLNRATAQLAQWTRTNAAECASLTMAVNISGRHVSNRRIIRDVTSALESSGIDPHRLVLEITETVLLEDLIAIHHLEQLRELGVSVSIDDFGIGYSSVSRLQQLPVDSVKIDQSFLDPSRRASRELLRLMVETAHALGLPVIAEGVEEEDQLQTLRAINCESAQGFLFARPMPAPDNGNPPSPTAAGHMRSAR
jgi:diguanylate cyclase